MCIYYATTNNTSRNEALWSYVHINDIYPMIITNTTLWQHWVTWGGYLLWKWRRMGLTPQSTFTIRFGEAWRGFPTLSGVWYHLMLNIQGKKQVEYYYTLDDINKILRPNQDFFIWSSGYSKQELQCDVIITRSIFSNILTTDIP